MPWLLLVFLPVLRFIHLNAAANRKGGTMRKRALRTFALSVIESTWALGVSLAAGAILLS